MGDFENLYQRVRHMKQQGDRMAETSAQCLLDTSRGVDRLAEHFELSKQMAVTRVGTDTLMALATNPINIVLKESR
jgi:hypothetical protein